MQGQERSRVIYSQSVASGQAKKRAWFSRIPELFPMQVAAEVGSRTTAESLPFPIGTPPGLSFDSARRSLQPIHLRCYCKHVLGCWNHVHNPGLMCD